MKIPDNPVMSKVEQIEAKIERLSVQEKEQIRDWLEDLLEDQLEFTDKFRASIERGERDIAEGRTRVEKTRGLT
jgi:hypothetical protein